VKASGLAAGKGVIVCESLAEADQAIDEMLEGNRFGAAGAEVLVEEFMEGEELSVFVITDGRSFVPLPGLQDHKRLLDGDRGPNTGGMGAYLPVSLPDPAGRLLRAEDAVPWSVIIPTLRELARRGRPFEGLLYAGVMITRDGPKVVEFNCRFGDPETEALLPLLDPVPLLPMLLAVARQRPLCGWPVDAEAAREIEEELGRAPDGFGVPQMPGASVTTVLAAANYPDAPRLGDVITLPPAEEGVTVFHAGTARDDQGRLVTAGGRVLAVTAVAPTIGEAQQRSLDYARRVDFAGKQLRSDIGWRELARHSAIDAGAAGD
jgi:phosphoribosylamine--glycine ligase